MRNSVRLSWTGDFKATRFSWIPTQVLSYFLTSFTLTGFYSELRRLFGILTVVLLGFTGFRLVSKGFTSFTTPALQIKLIPSSSSKLLPYLLGFDWFRVVS